MTVKIKVGTFVKTLEEVKYIPRHDELVKIIDEDEKPSYFRVTDVMHDYENREIIISAS